MGYPERQLARAQSIADLRILARRRLPKAVFDFIDGGAADERTLRGNEAAFDDWFLVPRVGVDVQQPRPRTPLSGCIVGHAHHAVSDWACGILSSQRRSAGGTGRGAQWLAVLACRQIPLPSIEEVAAGRARRRPLVSTLFPTRSRMDGWPAAARRRCSLSSIVPDRRLAADGQARTGRCETASHCRCVPR